MKIHHVALWTNDLEKLVNFYVKYFNCTPNQKYTNHIKSFESYFLEFNGGMKLEIMSMPSISENKNDLQKQYIGITHIALSAGSREKVNQLTDTLRSDGYTVASNPRETGDGYYESCILDPEGNRIEIVA
jgi:lactoylglutathione lyase